MNDAEIKFNQAAAALTPADMPADLPDEQGNGPLVVETCVFSLPDFRDAAPQVSTPSESRPSESTPTADATAGPVTRGRTLRNQQPEPAASPQPAEPVAKRVAEPVSGPAQPKFDAVQIHPAADNTLHDFQPHQLDEMFQRIDNSFFAPQAESAKPDVTLANEEVIVFENVGDDSTAEPQSPEGSDSEWPGLEGSDSEWSDSVARETGDAGSGPEISDFPLVDRNIAQPDDATFAGLVGGENDRLESPRMESSKPARTEINLSESAVQAVLTGEIAACRIDCQSLIKSFVQRARHPGPGVFLFCDVDAPLRSGRTAATLARELAVATGKRVLLIDSDLEFGALTRTLGLEKVSGTREMLRAMFPWSRLLTKTSVSQVDMLVCGTQKLRFTGPSSFVEGVWRKNVLEMGEDYGFVLVTTGTAFDNSLHLWSNLCDGTCLTLDAQNTSRSIAQAAIRELRASGCRVLGCVPVVTGPAIKTSAARVA